MTDKRTRDVLDRLMAKVVKTETCWNFTGCLKKGYGYVWLGDGKTAIAHRIVYERLVGPIPDGLTIDHLCRNRACVNPAHLEPVTLAENTARGTAWDFHRSKTHCPQGHEYNDTNTYISRRGDRMCRPCRRASKNEWAAKNKDHVREYQRAYDAKRKATA